MKKIHFLALVKAPTKVHINRKNMHEIPTLDDPVKEVLTEKDLPVGALLYIHNAELEIETKSLTVRGYTILIDVAVGIMQKLQDDTVPPCNIP